MKVTAVIVAKRDSERLKSKNMLPFGYSTLLGHKIHQLSECETINEVVVGSDCDEILSFARDRGAKGVKRSEKYCDEKTCSANQMIGNMCSLIDTDVVVWAHCTNPLVRPSTYDEAVNTYLKKIEEHDARGTSNYFDSLISVDAVQEHFWGLSKGSAHPIYHDPYHLEHVLAKDLPMIYKQNGAIFIQPHEQMKKNSYFYGGNPYLFITPTEQSVDINTELDYKIAKHVHENFFI
jgi:CMP-N,N'-diacetyllegionaminic acid synthase